MLIKFAVSNFRSIRERIEFSLEKTSLKGFSSNYFSGPFKYALLKSSIVYGPNASGKSTLLLGIHALSYLVMKSADYKPGERIEPYEPHKLEKSYSNSPVCLEIEFITNNIKYDYHVSFLERSIEREELYFYPNSTKSLLFSRLKGRGIKFGDYYRGGKKTIEKLLLDNQLFVSKAVENNVESVQDVHNFFMSGLIVFPFTEEYRKTSFSSLYAKRLAENKNSRFARRFNALICALDTGISSVSAEEVDWNEFNFPTNMSEDIKKQFLEQYRYDIKTEHQLFDSEKIAGLQKFEFDDESTGTQSLFVNGGIILDALESGRVLVVDEFENLHPNITHFLIQLFHNPITNPLNSQLILATHDISQLSNDFFRRDQVWFSEKNEFGATSFYRCSDIKGVRLGTPLDKWYESGRFGATPVINDINFLIEMQNENN